MISFHTGPSGIRPSSATLIPFVANNSSPVRLVKGSPVSPRWLLTLMIARTGNCCGNLYAKWLVIQLRGGKKNSSRWAPEDWPNNNSPAPQAKNTTTKYISMRTVVTQIYGLPIVSAKRQ